MSCLLQIRSIRNELSANEKKLADYILNNAALLRDYSSQQLASAVGVSQSSVVKFCQKLGYRGYPDLKLVINESIARSLGSAGAPPASSFVNSALNDISDQLLKSKLEAISATIDLNKESSFIAAIDAIKKAERIQIFGVGVSRFVAEHLAIRLLNSDKLAFALNDSAYQKQFLSRLIKGDLLILLSQVDELKLDKSLVVAMRERGVTLLHIGKYSANSNTHLLDIDLSTVSGTDTSETNTAGTNNTLKHDVAKRAAQQHIVDILLAMALAD